MNTDPYPLSKFVTARSRVTVALSRPALVVILGWFGFGATLLSGGILGVETNPALYPSPVPQKIILGLALTVGSTLISLAALHWRNATTSWWLELIALPILTSAWILYTVALFLADPNPAGGWALSPIALGLSFIAACIIRLLEVLSIIRRTRRNIADLPEELLP